MAPWTRAQVGVLLVSGFDFMVCSMFLLLGAAETGFLRQDVVNYSFYTSLIDVAVRLLKISTACKSYFGPCRAAHLTPAFVGGVGVCSR